MIQGISKIVLRWSIILNVFLLIGVIFFYWFGEFEKKILVAKFSYVPRGSQASKNFETFKIKTWSNTDLLTNVPRPWPTISGVNNEKLFQSLKKGGAYYFHPSRHQKDRRWSCVGL